MAEKEKAKGAEVQVFETSTFTKPELAKSEVITTESGGGGSSAVKEKQAVAASDVGKLSDVLTPVAAEKAKSPVQRYAVLDKGKVVNIVIWDGVSNWSPDKSCTVRLAKDDDKIVEVPEGTVK